MLSALHFSNASFLLDHSLSESHNRENIHGTHCFTICEIMTYWKLELLLLGITWQYPLRYHDFARLEEWNWTILLQSQQAELLRKLPISHCRRRFLMMVVVVFLHSYSIPCESKKKGATDISKWFWYHDIKTNKQCKCRTSLSLNASLANALLTTRLPLRLYCLRWESQALAQSQHPPAGHQIMDNELTGTYNSIPSLVPSVLLSVVQPITD